MNENKMLKYYGEEQIHPPFVLTIGSTVIHDYISLAYGEE